jgi:DNA-binding CsgD family transcriptional regulator
MATRTRVRAALATVEAADAAVSLIDLPDLLLPALMETVPGESVLWTELDLSTGPRPARLVSYPELPLNAELAAALEQNVPDFPLTRHTRPGGPGTPIRRSDLQSMTAFRGSGMYWEVARRLGIDQMVAMALTHGQRHVCISLNRAHLDFAPAQVDLLTQLRPLLTRRLARLAASPVNGPRADPADLTVRQRQVLALVAEGLTDVAIGHRLGCSPRTVDKHLEHIYRKLGVSGRTAALATASERFGPDSAAPQAILRRAR